MKYKCICLLCAVFFQYGCASVAVDGIGGINGGNAKTNARVKAAIFDVATLPAQAIILPVAFVASEANSSKKMAVIEQQQKDFLIIQQLSEKIKNDPLVIINDNYLNKDIKSHEYRALQFFMEKESRGIKLPKILYEHFHEKTNSKNHNHTYGWFIRNEHIPVHMLVDLYHRTFESEYLDGSSNSILMNRRLPLELLEKSQQHPLKHVARTAEIMLSVRREEVKK